MSIPNHSSSQWLFILLHIHDGVNTEKVKFETEDGWKKYVDSKRLEITCGEAPYIVSRYDAATGELLEIRQRIGILDRKLRVVNENTDSETEWFR